MDIKEIAQALELKMQDPDDGRFDIGEFAEALISAYKAELLKEVGELVYQVCKSDSVSLSAAWIDVTEQTYNDAGLYPEYGRRILYTSDQLAAAVLKATKPLEERRCEICGYAEHHREHTGCLRKQASSLKAELREICAAIDDPACDLTLTAAECIKKLKAENESLKSDAERYRWLKNNDSPIGIYSNTDFGDCYYIHEPDEAIDAAMAQGE